MDQRSDLMSLISHGNESCDLKISGSFFLHLFPFVCVFGTIAETVGRVSHV